MVSIKWLLTNIEALMHQTSLWTKLFETLWIYIKKKYKLFRIFMQKYTIYTYNIYNINNWIPGSILVIEEQIYMHYVHYALWMCLRQFWFFSPTRGKSNWVICKNPAWRKHISQGFRTKTTSKQCMILMKVNLTQEWKFSCNWWTHFIHFHVSSIKKWTDLVS
jgi:hypothetical protein